MTVTIGSTELSRLTAQPFGYEESDTQKGQTARRWQVTGLATPAEWLDLLGEYDAWRDTRITDEDTLSSGVVGTVVAFSGNGPGGQSWTDVDCWFSSAPQANQSGAFLEISFTIVDANQALEVLLRQQELSEDEDLPDLGTVNIGGVTLKLLRPMESYGDGPSLELTPAGYHYVSGPYVVYKVRDIEGTTDETGWDGIRSWYESTIVAQPSTGDWFPISIPTASAKNKVIEGVKVTEYTVSIELGRVL